MNNQFTTLRVMFNERDISICSQGRNGTADTYGVAAWVSPDYEVSMHPQLNRVPYITLHPVLKSGKLQNGDVTMSLEGFWRLVAELEKAGLREEVSNGS